MEDNLSNTWELQGTKPPAGVIEKKNSELQVPGKRSRYNKTWLHGEVGLSRRGMVHIKTKKTVYDHLDAQLIKSLSSS